MPVSGMVSTHSISLGSSWASDSPMRQWAGQDTNHPPRRLLQLPRKSEPVRRGAEFDAPRLPPYLWQIAKSKVSQQDGRAWLTQPSEYWIYTVGRLLRSPAG